MLGSTVCFGKKQACHATSWALSGRITLTPLHHILAYPWTKVWLDLEVTGMTARSCCAHGTPCGLRM